MEIKKMMILWITCLLMMNRIHSTNADEKNINKIHNKNPLIKNAIEKEPTTTFGYFANLETFYLTCYTQLKGIFNRYVDDKKHIDDDYLGILVDGKLPNSSVLKKYLEEITKDEVKAVLLYNNALKYYSKLSIFKSLVNPYHNVCHGFMTMIIAGELYKDLKEFNENKYRMILYAGLMHDAGHPGLGNSFLADLNYKTLYIQKFKDVYDINLTDDLCELVKNEMKCSLEIAHRLLAEKECEKYLEDLCKDTELKNLLDYSIEHTNMKYAFFTPKEGNVHKEELIVHFADIAASTVKNTELVLLTSYGVLTEFFYESYKYPNSALCSKNINEVTTNEEIPGLVTGGQTFFNNVFLTGYLKIPDLTIDLTLFDFLLNNKTVNQIKTKFSSNNESTKIALHEYIILNLDNNVKNENLYKSENYTIRDLPFQNLTKDVCLKKSTQEIDNVINDNTTLLEFSKRLSIFMILSILF